MKQKAHFESDRIKATWSHLRVGKIDQERSLCWNDEHVLAVKISMCYVLGEGNIECFDVSELCEVQAERLGLLV